MDWFYKVGEAKVGPVNDREMRELAELGTITHETMVWNERDARWQPFGGSGRNMADSLTEESPDEADHTPEPRWDGFADAEHYAEPADTDTAAPSAESYCARCFKKFANEDMVRYGTERFCGDCEKLFSSELKKNDAAAPRLPLAGFCMRLLAKLIDAVIMGVIGILLYATAVFLLLWTDAIFMTPARMIIFALVYLSWFMSFIGYAAFFVGKYGATPGKLALGLKVVDVDGVKVGYVKALGRCLAEVVSTIPLALGYVMAAFDIEKRTLHDRICGTRVILISARK